MQIYEELELEVPVSLVQIRINNLIRNAIEHTIDGIFSTNTTNLVISDNSSGILASELPLIFVRSYPAKKNGMGLGLNLLKRICDRYNCKWI